MARTFGFGPKEETSTFTREPPRTTLIDPPAGYRTPSADQPYGVGSKAAANNNVRPKKNFVFNQPAFTAIGCDTHE